MLSYMSLFGCRRGCTEERVDPGRGLVIFQNLCGGCFCLFEVVAQGLSILHIMQREGILRSQIAEGITSILYRGGGR